MSIGKLLMHTYRTWSFANLFGAHRHFVIIIIFFWHTQSLLWIFHAFGTHTDIRCLLIFCFCRVDMESLSGTFFGPRRNDDPSEDDRSSNIANNTDNCNIITSTTVWFIFTQSSHSIILTSYYMHSTGVNQETIPLRMTGRLTHAMSHYQWYYYWHYQQ